MMLTKRDMHGYQQTMVNQQVSNPHSMIWGFMGSGKTAVTLTTISHLIEHRVIRAALVIGPLRVIQSVWDKEARKWQHLKHLTFRTLHGNKDFMTNELFKPADVYLVNYEGLEKLSGILHHRFISKGTLLPFDMLVADESSKIKNPDTVRVQSLAPLLEYFIYRTGLTGTPAPNGYIDLFGQYYVIDSGRRLGVDRDSYRAAYFKSGGHGGFSYTIAEGAKEIIHRAISDITLEMSQNDYLQLPDFIVQDIPIQLPARAKQQYDQMEILFWTELDEGGIIEVNSPLASINKLLQISNGAMYTNTETKEWSRIHDAKLDAVEDILEEAAGNPVLLGYNFRSDAERLKKKFKFAVDLSSLSGAEFNDAIYQFGQGRIKLLMGHPASMGFGVDGLQVNCNNIIWYGLPWSLELYLQLNARVHRQGSNGEPVRAYRLVGIDTMDEAVALKLEMKEDTQQALRDAVGSYRQSKMLTNVA